MYVERIIVRLHKITKSFRKKIKKISEMHLIYLPLYLNKGSWIPGSAPFSRDKEPLPQIQISDSRNRGSGFSSHIFIDIF